MERTHGEGSGHPEDCFGCRIGDGPMISPSALPTRTVRHGSPDRPLANSWERGLATDSRGLPISGEKGPIGVKEYADNRSRIEKRLAEVRDPSYWASQAPASASAT